MTEVDRLLSDGVSLDDIKEAMIDERELDKDLQRHPAQPKGGYNVD